MKLKKKNCPNCGAPITAEICKYCNTTTGLDTENSNMEYPVIDCKVAKIGFVNTFISMFFAFSFVIVGLVMFVLLDSYSGVVMIFGKLLLFLFIIFGISFLVNVLVLVIRIIQTKLYGKEIDAIVYGYFEDSSTRINGKPVQIAKLLITTKDGPKFILYQLGDTTRPYEINSKIKLLVYKDNFRIVNKKKYYF